MNMFEESKKQREEMQRKGLEAIEGNPAYEFVNKEGILVRPIKGGLASVGRAYGFFYCDAPKNEIEAYLPKARENALTPNTLELTLEEGINPEHFNNDSELRELAYEAHQIGNNYTMVASLLDATNKKTAHELGDIQNALYQSPLQSKFHKDGGKFWGGTVYKEGAEYQFLE